MKYLINYFIEFGVDINTAATAIITLLIFISGLIVTWISKTLLELKEKRTYRKCMILILEDFVKSCEKQNRVVNESLQYASLLNGNDFIIKYTPIGTLDYLSKIDFSIFLKNFEPILTTNRYVKAISKLFEIIAQIKIQNDSLRNTAEAYMKEYKIHEKSFYDNLVHLREIHDKLGIELNGKKVTKNDETLFIQEYFRIFSHFSKPNVNLDIRTSYENVICPILELNKNNDTEISFTISNYALKCDIAYKNIEKIESHLKIIFSDFTSFHRRTARLTKIIIKIIR